jgi:hypothetical protein
MERFCQSWNWSRKIDAETNFTILNPFAFSFAGKGLQTCLESIQSLERSLRIILLAAHPIRRCLEREDPPAARPEVSPLTKQFSTSEKPSVIGAEAVVSDNANDNAPKEDFRVRWVDWGAAPFKH